MPLTPEEIAERDALRRELYPDQYDVSALEAGARGAAQGATLGFADELSAGVRGAASALTSPDRLLGRKASDIFEKTYQQEVARARDRDRMAAEQNPWSYGAANLAGNVASSLAVPGVQLARGGSLLSRIGTTAAASGVESGVQSYGESESFNPSEIAFDAALGAGIGGVAGGVFGAPRAAAKGAVEASKKAAGAVSDYAARKGEEALTAAEELFEEAASAADDIYRIGAGVASETAGLGAEAAGTIGRAAVETGKDTAQATKMAYDRLKGYTSQMSDRFNEKVTEAAGVAKDQAEQAYMSVVSGDLDDAMKDLADTYGKSVAEWIVGSSKKNHLNMLMDVVPKNIKNEETLGQAFHQVTHPFYRKTDTILRDWARRNNIDLNNPSKEDLQRLERWSQGDARDNAIREFESGLANDISLKRQQLKGLKHFEGGTMTRELRHAEAVQQQLIEYERDQIVLEDILDRLKNPRAEDLPVPQKVMREVDALGVEVKPSASQLAERAAKEEVEGIPRPPTAKEIADELVYRNIKKLSPYHLMDQDEAVKRFYKDALERRLDIERRIAQADGVKIPQGPKLTYDYLDKNPELVDMLRKDVIEENLAMTRAKNEFLQTPEGRNFASSSVLRPKKPIPDQNVFVNSALAGMMSGSFGVGMLAAGLQFAYNNIQKNPRDYIRLLDDYKNGRISIAKASGEAVNAFYKGTTEARDKLAKLGLSTTDLKARFARGFEEAAGKADAAKEALKDTAQTFGDVGSRAAGRLADTAVDVTQKGMLAADVIGTGAREAAGRAKEYGTGIAGSVGSVAKNIGKDVKAGAGAVKKGIDRAVEVANKIAEFSEKYGPKAASALHRTMMEKDSAYRDYVQQKESGNIDARMRMYR